MWHLVVAGAKWPDNHYGAFKSIPEMRGGYGGVVIEIEKRLGFTKNKYINNTYTRDYWTWIEIPLDPAWGEVAP